MAHYSIFRQELAIAYPTYGNALWEPDPGGQYNSVEVGDVGFIRRGYFQRLFNVLLPKDHPSHRNPSFVPEDHHQLGTIHDHIVKNEIRTGSRQNSLHFCSQSVTLDSRGRGTSASGFCEDTVAFGDFGKWMIKHIDVWFAFARDLGLGINRMEDIILVTGRHLTKSWVNVAFTQRRPDAGVSFDVQVSGHSHVSLEQEYVRGGDLKLGPTGRDLPGNQCIFIRGFRVARILGMWPKLRGQAGPAPNPGDQEPEPESDPQLELISVPDDSDFQDPLHDLLQYVAEQAPDCDMALVHDDELACMDVAPRTALRTHGFMGHLRKSAPTIQQCQCELLSGDISGPGADVTIAMVATLSEHAFEAPRKGSDLNPILTAAGATGRSTPVAGPQVVPFVSTLSRPDRVAYDVKLKRIETRIGLLHEMLAAVNDDISNMALVNESFQVDSDAIDAEHAAENLRKRLDDPKAKAASEHYHALEGEMNVTKRKVDLFGNPSLFELQRKLKRQIITLFSKRYDLISRLRQDDTQYYAMLHERRFERAEWWSAESKGDLLVEIEDQIEDCQTLIEYFSGMLTAAMVNFVPLVKTGEEEGDYFVGTKDRGGLGPATGELLFSQASGHPRMRTVQACERCRARKASCSGDHPTCQRCLERGLVCKYAAERRIRRPNKPEPPLLSMPDRSPQPAVVTGEMSSSSSIDLPFYTRSALRSLSILPPSSPSDVPRVVKNLEARKVMLEWTSEMNLLDELTLAMAHAGKPKSKELQETEVTVS